MEQSACEEKNYRHLYDTHARHLRNFLYYKCGDLDRAEDLTHEAFIKLWENCARVAFDKVKSFVFTVANRLFLNQVEHARVVLNFEKSATEKHNREDPEALMIEKEFKKRLEQAIAGLPEGQREVFLMNRIDKLSYQEIADLQGVSVKAIHKKIYKAMDKLKEALEELENRKI